MQEIAPAGGVAGLDRADDWQAAAAIRLLSFTGARSSEITVLQWDWIRGTRAVLSDSKSGPRTVWLSSAARAVIDAIPRYREDCPSVFPGRPPTRPVANIAYPWKRICDEAELPGLRLHDLRHSYASTAAMHGVDMVTIAKLLGHALVETTERYVRLSDQSVTDAADRVSGRIHAAPAGRSTAVTVGPTMPTVDLTAGLARTSGAVPKDTILFDRKLPGFGLRIHPSRQKVWIVQTRIEGRSRRIVIARHGEMKLAEARHRARDTLHRIRTGGNSADDIQQEKRTPTLREFTREYLRRCEPHWKPSGRRTMRIYPRPASCPRSAGCRSTASAARTWPLGSTRQAGTNPARPTGRWKSCAR